MGNVHEEVNRYMDLPYRIVLLRDETCDEEPCIVAEHPELSGCISHGCNSEEALSNLREARRAYIESLLEDGLPVPLPEAAEVSVSEVDSLDFDTWDYTMEKAKGPDHVLVEVSLAGP